MKLHLPKSLLTAALVAMSSVAAFAGSNVELTDGFTVYNVGNGKSTDTLSSGIVVGDWNESTGNVDAIGYVADGKLVSFGSLGANLYTNTLKVNGSLTIQGDGQVILGGKQSSEVYGGLIANSVTVGATVEGAKTESEEVESPSLYASMTNIGTLTVNCGTVQIGGGSDCYTGNSSLSESNKKLAQITESLVVNGGSVTLGQYQASYYNNAHAQTGFGSYSLTGGGYKSADIIQNAGAIIARGYTIAVSGMQFKQTGGTMVFEGPLAFYGESLRNDNDSPAYIYQNGASNETVMSFNGIEVANKTSGLVNSGYNPKNMAINITQEGAGIINLNNGIKLATSAVSTITQQNYVNEVTKEVTSASGTINLNGDFTNVKFNLQQTATGSILDLNGKLNLVNNNVVNGILNVQAGAALSAANMSVSGTVTNNGTMNVSGELNQTAGTINVAANASMTASSVNVGGTFNVAEGGVLNAGAIKVTEGGTLINNGVISGSAPAMADADEVAAQANEDMLIVIAGGVMENYGETDKNILVQDGGALTLLDGASVGSVTMEQGGEVTINGTAVTGALTLTGGTVTFTEGATLQIADGTNVTISDAVSIVVNLSDASLDALKNGGTYTLFDTTSDIEAIDGSTMTFVGTGGDTITTTVNYAGEGAVELAPVVPEPTTATLSLLALAGFAARRRRR